MLNESRLTDKARNVIKNASKAAFELGHSCVGTEHLLLALTTVKDSVAAKALEEQNVTEEAVRNKIIDLVGKNEKSASLNDSSVTPKMKRIFEKSFDEAVYTGTTYVGTEHLLMALIKDGNSISGECYA
ncbi:MAG: ATP-dependent Clp protease ATP-binding subunit, partial [Firmicutes bacterium]|nr:ATP-dependent Clp protease ATP-binding subunit [Bacillota bacterium]